MFRVLGMFILVISLNSCAALGPILSVASSSDDSKTSEADLKKLESVRMPKDNYSYADKKTILKYMKKNYTKRYPTEEIRRIVIMDAKWSNVRKNYIHYKQLQAAICVHQKGKDVGTIFHAWFRKDAKFENSDMFLYGTKHKGHILLKNINL